MTKRDFFTFLIKVFGLYIVINSLFSLLAGNFTMMLAKFNTMMFIWVTMPAIVQIGLFALLIFKSNKVINLLQLDKGFDDDRIELGSLKPTDIIKIGIIIIGGLLIINNIPAFLSYTFFAFKRHWAGKGYSENEKFMWASSIMKLLIGYLLLVYYDLIAKKIKMKKKEGE